MSSVKLLAPKLCGLCTEQLQQCRDALGLEIGILSHITGGEYHVMAVIEDSGSYVPGTVFPLGATLCQSVYQNPKLTALSSYNGQPGLGEHPLWASLKLHAYIAAPLFINGETWGTVNFSSTEIRSNGFSAEDEAAVVRCAKTVTELLDAHLLSH